MKKKRLFKLRSRLPQQPQNKFDSLGGLSELLAFSVICLQIRRDSKTQIALKIRSGLHQRQREPVMVHVLTIEKAGDGLSSCYKDRRFFSNLCFFLCFLLFTKVSVGYFWNQYNFACTGTVRNYLMNHQVKFYSQPYLILSRCYIHVQYFVLYIVHGRQLSILCRPCTCTYLWYLLWYVLYKTLWYQYVHVFCMWFFTNMADADDGYTVHLSPDSLYPVTNSIEYSHIQQPIII